MPFFNNKMMNEGAFVCGKAPVYEVEGALLAQLGVDAVRGASLIKEAG